MKAVDLVIERLGDTARQGNGRWIAPCPAHRGTSRKLSIREGENGALLRCWSHGCSTEAICTAIGLQVRDLFDRHETLLPTPTARAQREPTENEITEAVDEHLARIVRRRTEAVGHAPPPLTSENILSAYRSAGRQLGINIPFQIPPTPHERAYTKEHLERALAERSSIYSPESKPGFDYLTSRKIDLRNNGILSREWVEANVKYHPRWLKCVALPAVIFAIRDHLGSLVATGSRYLHPRTPKEKAFSKGMIKLGAFQTPGALEAETIGITEAPIDAITLALCGLPSVATLGTNNIAKPWFWPHVRAHRIILALDRDESGNRAADALRLELGPARCVRFHFPEGITDANGFLCTDERALRLHIGSLLENPPASD